MAVENLGAASESTDDADDSGYTGETPLDALRRDVERDDPDDRRYFPALNKLHRDQHRWLDRWIQDGYGGRRELIFQLHQLQFWTLGHIPDSWYETVASENVPLSLVITSDRRRHYRRNPVSLENAREERRTFAAKYIRPAFRGAFRDVRTSANQYVDEDPMESDDVEQQSSVFMRPALDEWYQRQTRALLQLLDGFESIEGVDDWLASLDTAALGELRKVEPDWDWRIHVEDQSRRVLLEDEPKYATERERWAAVYLLPAFNRAVYVLVRHADELREDGERELLEREAMG